MSVSWSYLESWFCGRTECLLSVHNVLLVSPQYRPIAIGCISAGSDVRNCHLASLSCRTLWIKQCSFHQVPHWGLVWYSSVVVGWLFISYRKRRRFGTLLAGLMACSYKVSKEDQYVLIVCLLPGIQNRLGQKFVLLLW